jgi:hypothetical protein
VCGLFLAAPDAADEFRDDLKAVHGIRIEAFLRSRP